VDCRGRWITGELRPLIGANAPEKREIHLQKSRTGVWKEIHNAFNTIILRHNVVNPMLRSEFESHVATMRYVRPRQVRQLYPISNASLYELLNSGAVKSVRVAGARWVDVASFEAYVRKLADEQLGQAMPLTNVAKAKEKITGRRGKGGGDTEQISASQKAEPVRRGRGRPRKVRTEEVAA
jgi:hypothetical protein